MSKPFKLHIIYLIAIIAIASGSAVAQTFTRVDAFAPPFGPTQGTAWADYDGDGDFDVFVANGNVFAPDSSSTLYRNRGDGTFLRVVEGVIPEDRFAAFSGAWGDFDGDRDLDLLVAGSRGEDFNVEAISSPRLYRNEGFGDFSRAKLSAVSEDLRALTSAAIWFDLENDGDLDAYLGNDWGPNLSGTGVPNLLLRNDRHGIFTRIEGDPSVRASRQTLSVASSDFDADGDVDLFVGNGGAGVPGYADDNLYLNDGHGHFTEIADSDVVRSDGWTGAASWVDYDNDGDNDLFAANVFTPHFLFRNDGGGRFSRITDGALVTDTGSGRVGATWADFDNDGDLDVLANDSFGTPHFFYINDGSGTFTRRQTNITTALVGTSSGADYDLDGDIDLFIGDGAFGDGQNFLYRNEGTKNHWVSIQPQGRVSNSTGIGAKIWVRAKVGGHDLTQFREITQQANWGGHGPLLAHVGLRKAKLIDEIRVEWPSGKIDVERSIQPNVHYVAIEGRGLITLQEALILRLIERLDELAARKRLSRVHHVILRSTIATALKLAAHSRAHASERLLGLFSKQVNALSRKNALSEREVAWLLDPSATAQMLLARRN